MIVYANYRFVDKEVDLLLGVYDASQFDQELLQEWSWLLDEHSNNNDWEILGLQV